MADKIKSYRDLVVWQKALAWVTNIYKLADGFPPQEKFGLTNQVCCAAVSVPSKVAEGQARQSTNEFRHFLYIALGSLAEVDTQLLIAINLGYLYRRKADNLHQYNNWPNPENVDYPHSTFTQISG